MYYIDREDIECDLLAVREMRACEENLPTFFDYADAYECASIFDNVINIDILTDMTEQHLKKYGVSCLQHFLPEVIDGHNFFIIDGYDNIQNITPSMIEDFQQQLITFIEAELIEE